MDDVFDSKKPDMIVHIMAMGNHQPSITLNSSPLLFERKWLYAMVGMGLDEELCLTTPDVTELSERWGEVQSLVALHVKATTTGDTHFEVLKPGTTITIKNGAITYG